MLPLHPTHKIVESLAELSHLCDYQKRSGRKVVLTSGCFDLLHGGHLEYIFDAGKMGFLVVGINSNISVKRLRGESRPIRDQRDRAFTMAGFYPVKLVTIFEYDHELISAVKPHIYVASSTSHVTIGNDPIRSALLKSIGAEVIELQSKKQDSTTDMIRRANA